MTGTAHHLGGERRARIQLKTYTKGDSGDSGDGDHIKVWARQQGTQASDGGYEVCTEKGTEKRGLSPHMGAGGFMRVIKQCYLAGSPGLLDISPPPLPPPPPPPIPVGGLEYRRVFVNRKRQLAWPRVHCKI